MILAPLRGVTVRVFRRTFGRIAADCGFDEAITPFIPAIANFDPFKDSELRDAAKGRLRGRGALAETPQFIGKDPSALKECLKRVRDAGIEYADLNCGCPFPMVRRKGRGSGLMRTPDTLSRLLEAGCETMGEGRFSAKTRLGIDSPREILALMDVFNAFPLRRLAIHARTARQMYEGGCDIAAWNEAAALARMPVVYNGDVGFDAQGAKAVAPDGVDGGCELMCGRGFVVALARRADSRELLERYIRDSLDDGMAEGAVLGRMKELLSYWAADPRWGSVWNKAKKARNLREFNEIALL